MKYLLPNYWENFNRDGKLFEKLSKVLIEYEYKQTDFYIVGGPGDEGKDICIDIPLIDNFSTQIWAQCKYHQRTLSFDDISYTLLMAYLKNTNQILIFSYSKVSKSFLENLTEYKVRTRKNVILYADEDLERLILKHRVRLIREHKEFFASFPNVHFSEANVLQTNYQLYVDGIRITRNEVTIGLNTICELVIILINQSDNDIEIALSCIKNRVSRNFCFIDDNIQQKYILPSNASVSFKTFIKLKKSISKTSLPSFSLTYNENHENINSKIKLKYRWLADTILIGKRYYTALNNIYMGIQYSHFHLTYIYGSSGVGKSRLLKESQEHSIRLDKKIIYIDSEKKDFSCKKFIEILCSKMTLLPIFNRKITVLSNVQEPTIEYATKILYDDSYNITKEWETATKLIANLMINEKFVLILDNIQHFDKISLQITEYLITLLKNSKCESNILLGINTDYVYKNSIFDELFCQLKRLSSTDPEYYSGIELYGFESCDSELFIRECLSYNPNDTNITHINYKKAIKKIANHCGNNPFYIQQFLLYLYQKGIIARSKNTLFYFCDVDTFNKSFYKLPQSINELIKEREMLLLNENTINFTENYHKIVWLLNLTKTLSQEIYYNIIGDNNLMNTLLDMGFISLIDGYIVPYHNYYNIYFSNNYAIDSIPHNLLNQFISTVNSICNKKDLALPYFWAKHHTGVSTLSDLELIINEIKLNTFDCIAFEFCLKSISVALEANRNNILTNEYLAVYKNICAKLDETVGIESSLYYYEKILSSFIEQTEKHVDAVDCSLSLIRSYLIHLINLEKYEKFETVTNSIVNQLSYFKSEEQYKITYILNSCKIMIYNRTNIVGDAVSLAEENLRILEQEITDNVFRNKYIYSAKRSIGNTYFYSTVAYNKRQNIIDSWSESFKSFIKIYGNDTESQFSFQPKVAAFAKGLAADMISNNEYEAQMKAVFFENAFDKMNMMYYEMQIRLLISAYIIWKWSDSIYYHEHLPEINKYIDQAIDIAAIYGRKLTTINAFHLRAVAYYLDENYELAWDNYNITSELLLKYLKTEYDYTRWDYFWVDMSRSLRKYNESLYKGVMNRFDKHVQEHIERINSMSKCEFEEYEENYTPMTALTDKEYKINFPKI